MKTNLLLIIIGIILLNSCGSDPVIRRYFILDDYQPETVITDTVFTVYPLPFNVKIEPFAISRSYNQDRIALRTRSNEIQFYYNNNWAESPASAVRYFMWQKLKQQDVFQSCEINLTETTPTHLIKASINHIERQVRKNDHAAHLEMVLELKKMNNDNPDVIYSFDRFEPIEEDARMNIFAQAISKILVEETTVFIEKIHEKYPVNRSKQN